MEIRRFEFQSVVGYAESAPRFARLQVEENRDVGQETVYCRRIDFFYEVRAQTASVTLIRNGTVHVSVAHHEFASFERGLYDLAHELRSRRGVKIRFGDARHLVVFGVENDFADLLAYMGAARFTHVNRMLIC